MKRQANPGPPYGSVVPPPPPAPPMRRARYVAPDRREVEPYPVEKMTGTSLPRNTICAVLRDIFTRSQDEDIKRLARIATTMAKKMSAKLYESAR